MSNKESGDVKNKHEKLMEWLDQLKLSRPKKRIHRDFADGVLLAEIISRYYPKLIEMNCYQSGLSYSTKMENWKMLNQKVLKKLNVGINSKTIEKLCNCTPGVIEKVLIDVKEKICKDEDLKNKLPEGDKKSIDEVFYDIGAVDETSETMFVPIRRRRQSSENVEIIRKKVISFDNYLAIQNELGEKNEGIYILNQKVTHLENLLKVKDNHIEALQKQLSRKNLCSRKFDPLYYNLLPTNEGKNFDHGSDLVDIFDEVDVKSTLTSDSLDQEKVEIQNITH